MKFIEERFGKNPETDLMQKPKRVRNDIRSEEEGKKKYIEKIKK